MVRFECKTGSGVSMLEQDAKQVLELMKHSGDVPGAILAEDVNDYLANLQTALSVDTNGSHQADNSEDDEEDASVTIATRAYPLIELLKRAKSEQEDVLWRNDDSVI